MPVLATCTCGSTFKLKDEYAGKRLKCPKCGGAMRAPALAMAAAPGTLSYEAAPMGNAVFDRDRFLLRQKMISLNQKYTVSDEQNQPIALVIRPTYIARSLLAALAAIVTLIVVGGALLAGVIGLASWIQNSGGQSDILMVIASVGG